jgi:hypothetical protein
MSCSKKLGDEDAALPTITNRRIAGRWVATITSRDNRETVARCEDASRT